MPLIVKYKSQAWAQTRPEAVTPAGDSLIESSRLFTDTATNPSKPKRPKLLGPGPEPKRNLKDGIKRGRGRPKKSTTPRKARAKKSSKSTTEPRLKEGIPETRRITDSHRKPADENHQHSNSGRRSRARSTRRRNPQGRDL